MSRQLTEEEAREHYRVYKQGWSLIKGELLLAGRDLLGRPGWLSTTEARIECFEAALRISLYGVGMRSR